jgi:hypothetical protein
MVAVVLISLFLQSCNQFSNALIPSVEEAQGTVEDNQQLQLDSQDSLKEAEDKNLITQGGNQIPGKPMQSEVSITKPFELATTTSAYSQETGTQGYTKLTDFNLGIKQSKRVNQGGLTQADIKRKKTTQSQVSLHQRGPIETIKKVVKTKQEPTKNRAVLGSPFDILPRDLLPGILAYLSSKEIGQVRQLNLSLYKLTTGYERPGMVGVENKPTTNCLVRGLNTRTVDFKEVEGLTPKTISSFAFYQLMGEARNLPSIFWAYIKGTKVHTVDLRDNQIGPSGAVDLAKNLKGTSVHIINLGYNQIGPSGAVKLAKNLKGTSVHIINLGYNHIGDSGAIGFAKNLQGTGVHIIDLHNNQIGALGAVGLAKNLPGTSVHTIYLDHNQIGALGAAELAKNLQGTSVHTICLGNNQISGLGAAELAKNLQGTSVHTIDLSNNQIGASGAVELAKNLKGTSVHTIDLSNNEIGASGAAELAKNLKGLSVHTINLGGNKIGAPGAVELAKNLQGTSVHTVNLGGNKIGDLGVAELAKNLKETSVHTVNLGGNKISASGAAELAKNLQGTSVHTVNLGGNKIGYKTQNLLKQQYTNIQWTF